MKTNIDIVISTSEEAKAFLTELHNNEESYHPEDSASNIIDICTGECFFTEEETEKLDYLMECVYEYAEFDPCEHLLNLMNLETN